MSLDPNQRTETGRLHRPLYAIFSAICLSIFSVVGTALAAVGENDGELSAEIVRLWPYHASLVILGFLLMVWGMTFARRKGPGWLKKHRALGITGSIVALGGAMVAVYMISAASSVHFRVPHAYIGAFVVLLLILTPSLGHFQLKVAKERRGRVRGVHRLLGRAVLLLMALNMLFGVMMVTSA
ncbi:hypothetical protein P0O24_08410 [Methanotrichaceae archaeon M04Ac]|uniref:Cytochrome b561 domain-containing protein n=1 Tax=Candidatus Methanocrinis alkalitolerans TaxID=3033395 RepID=A0ABT5XFV4_9EURY|nr:hypothetical protein [Candidatus Methanocrinis alkalitolerans]MCR3883180.1 hypothetical protein [Methanothrix sp.]MDF0593603.1 hypothetical protein [Candidatus Methanocrinis alkalitolerans]